MYYTEYGCTFDLRSFPFDDQKCSMYFTMESANASYIELNVNENDITYKVSFRVCLTWTACTISSFQGEKVLLEFQISNKFGIAGRGLVNEQNKSYVAIQVEFHRELGNMVNTYFQTFLLCLLAYLTLYINIADFANRRDIT